MSQSRSSYDTPWLLLSIAALIPLCLFILYPLINLLIGGFRDDGNGMGWVQILNSPTHLEAIANTLILATIVTFICIVLGVPLAYVTARYNFPAKAIIALLPLITLVLPEVVTAQTWLMMLGNNGVITRFLRGFGVRLPTFYGWFGLIATLSFIYYTYIYIGTVAAIKKFDATLEEAAQSLGTSPLRSRLKVMLPVILPAILASSLLVFTMAVGNFATSSILGQRVPLLSVMTYRAALAEGATSVALQSALATTSIIIVMSVLFFNRWIINRGRYEIVQGRGAKPSRLRGAGGFLAAAPCALIVLISLLPLITIIVGSFTFSRGPVMRWGEWTFDNFTRVFITAPQPLINSLTYAGTATAISIIFSAMVSYLIVKKPTMLTRWIDYISSIPLALSGTVLGVGLLAAFNGSWLPITGTSIIIVLAYVIRRMPFGLRNSQATLHNIPGSIEEASISLGSPPLRTFFHVVLPMMLPAVAAAAILTWVTTVAELSASILVYSGGRETMPIAIYRLVTSDYMAYASAYNLVLIAVILLPIIIATTIFKVDLFSTGK